MQDPAYLSESAGARAGGLTTGRARDGCLTTRLYHRLLQVNLGGGECTESEGGEEREDEEEEKKVTLDCEQVKT